MNPFDSIDDRHANIGHQSEMDSIDVSRIEPYDAQTVDVDQNDITDDSNRPHVIRRKVVRFDKRKAFLFVCALLCFVIVLVCVASSRMLD